MKSSFNIFLRRTGKRGHEELTVLIDWSDVTEEDFKRLAAWYVLHRAEHDLRGYDTRLPESVEYRAADFLHDEPLTQRPEPEIPAKWKEPPKSRTRKELEAAFAQLSPEEIKTLLAD